MKVKGGVQVLLVTFKTPEMWRILSVVQEEAPAAYEPTLTCGSDGKHKDGSKHYVGFALDFRIHDFPPANKVETWRNRIQARLGGDYFVLIEPTHLHVQWNKGVVK